MGNSVYDRFYLVNHVLAYALVCYAGRNQRGRAIVLLGVVQGFIGISAHYTRSKRAADSACKCVETSSDGPAQNSAHYVPGTRGVVHLLDSSCGAEGVISG